MSIYYTSSKPDRVSHAFSHDENIVLCATSLHHRRYIEDIIHSIGLPVGSHITLRYRKPYVDQSCWGMLDLETLPKARALIAVTGQKEDGTPEIVPLRKGTVVAGRCDGDLATLDIILQEYVFTSTAKVSFLNSLCKVASRLPGNMSGPDEGTELYLQTLSAPPENLFSSAAVTGWEKVAAAFFEIDHSLKNSSLGSLVPFLYHIKRLGGIEANKLNKRGGVFVKMGDRLDIEVHTIARPTGRAIRNPIGEVVFDLSHAAASFISSRRMRVDSSRDMKKIGIITTPLFSGSDGHLSIRMSIFKVEEPETESIDPQAKINFIPASERAELMLARYDFPLRVGGLRPLLASGLIAGAAALSVYKFSSQGGFVIQDALIPGVVFVFTFFGLSFGIIKK